MCESSSESAEIADSGEKGLQHVNNRLFNMDKPMNSSDLTYYLLQWGSIGSMAAVIKTTNQTFKVNISIHI